MKAEGIRFINGDYFIESALYGVLFTVARIVERTSEVRESVACVAGVCFFVVVFFCCFLYCLFHC